MPVTFSANFRTFPSDSRSRVKGFVSDLGRAMEQAMKFGEQVGQDRIETSGTGFEGRRGRVVSGEMRDRFVGKVTKQSLTKIVGELGWTENSPYYALFQEYGFRHAISGKMVDGMFALRDSGDDAWEEFLTLADQALKKWYN